jgi:hypothetical protein
MEEGIAEIPSKRDRASIFVSHDRIFFRVCFSNISGTPDICCTDETSVMALRACNLGVGGGQDQRVVPKESRILERPRSCLKTVRTMFLLTGGVASNAPPVHGEWFSGVDLQIFTSMMQLQPCDGKHTLIGNLTPFLERMRLANPT